ncbi:hypothetical protein MLD38_025914 [Melastoma candidum]|uniref:Uncharacterized protein n=1 Tax=Melastoma candidum TaxID=119954 RepID=A0ACB9NYP8_9MYRT|nr:hypothetical protein MLD38_025914 [Melastoma candidum]
MSCVLLSRVLRFFCRRILRLLFRSFPSVMRYFFVCLRFKDDHCRDKESDAAVYRNCLSSFLAVEESEDRTANPECNWGSGSPRFHKEIQDEARFLKACGTIPETPVEIRKAGEKMRRSSPSEDRSVTPKFHSWMPNASLRKHFTDKQPVKLSEGFEIDVESPEHTMISCVSSVDSSTEGAASGKLISAYKVIDEEIVSMTSPFTPWPTGIKTQGGSKSVQFQGDINKCPSDDYQPENTSRGFKTGGGGGGDKDRSLNFMPPPTPLKLTDEMQTPGTVFPANMDLVQKGKVGIRSQYVYSVANHPTDALQLKVHDEEISQHNQLLDHQEAKFEATLSNWLKPPTDDGKSFQPVHNKQAQFGRTYEDRPIPGVVSTQWNEEEQSHVIPKWWGGNAIPNSTSKYQEVQKVSWHATQFEERLEKALSEENFFSNRSHVSGSPMTLEEDTDSATYQLLSEKTLVSC